MMYKERKEIEKYAKKVLGSENDCYFFAGDLFEVKNKDDCYYEALKKFKSLFNKDDKCRIYLWNELWDYAISCEIDENDFSEEEALFIKEIKNYYLENRLKYGPKFSRDININKEIETNNLILKPYDSDLNELYLNHFKENQEEFENYYHDDFDEQYFRFCCSQNLSKLSFAIFLKNENIYIGSLALNELRLNCVYNLEYYIMPDYRKRGYAYEAANKLISMAKNRELIILEETIKSGVYNETPADIKCIEAKINTINDASIKLAKKLGFEYTGKVLYAYENKNTYYDEYVYDYLIK